MVTCPRGGEYSSGTDVYSAPVIDKRYVRKYLSRINAAQVGYPGTYQGTGRSVITRRCEWVSSALPTKHAGGGIFPWLPVSRDPCPFKNKKKTELGPPKTVGKRN
jgi:hypothetical protein